MRLYKRALGLFDPGRHDDVPILRAVRRMAGREDQPLQLAMPEEHPRRGRKNNPLCIDSIAEAAERRLNEQDVAETDQVELQERVRMRHAMAGYCDCAGVPGQTRSRVVARPFRENTLRCSFIERQVLV